MNHIDDLVELYALGALDELERRRVDAHVTTCAQCARALGEAEAAVTFAIEADPQYEPSLALGERLRASVDVSAPRAARWPAWRTIALAAACVLVAMIIPASLIVSGNHGEPTAMLASATFKMMRPTAMTARVMYSKRGDFYAVMVDHPMPSMHVAYVHPDGTMETIGTLKPQGKMMGVAVMPIDHKMPLLALVDGSTVVAEATLAFN